MNYLLDGRCEISNNAAERRAKSYATARKNFLFHDTVDGANASAIVMSLIETAKANNLNIYQYLYTLLLYMPDYKNEPAGIKQLMPWSEFIKENCSGITDTKKYCRKIEGTFLSEVSWKSYTGGYASLTKVVQGWINYYTQYYKSEFYEVLRYINQCLIKWVRRSYKKKNTRSRAEHWLGAIARRDRNLFAHWKFGILPSVGEGAV